MSFVNLSVHELVDRCLRARDEEPWAELVRRLQPLIAGVVVRTCHRCGVEDLQIIDDLIQETFLKLCRDDARILRNCDVKDELSFFGYIKVAAANVVYDSYKYRMAERRSFKAEEALDCDVPVQTSGTVDPLLHLDIDRVLSDEKITNRDRSIFWMYFRQGFSSREIAQAVNQGLGIKGVESCLRRLTTLLRQRFGQALAEKGEGN